MITLHRRTIPEWFLEPDQYKEHVYTTQKTGSRMILGIIQFCLYYCKEWFQTSFKLPIRCGPFWHGTDYFRTVPKVFTHLTRTVLEMFFCENKFID